ncbi:MAG: hypothetical protein K0V04_14855 [Deltaproteobacteria bacterium]|nr:hypothetical protein [Deltaproteobacteria bacterium]
MNLLAFFERTKRWRVPRHSRAWARDHVDLEYAIDHAYPVHLMWLSSRCTDQSTVLVPRIDVRAQYACAQYDSDDAGAAQALREASAGLRRALLGTPWWDSLNQAWQARQTQGLGVARYRLDTPTPVLVRGTAVGAFAVRELRWVDALTTREGPPLGHRERTPPQRHQSGPRYVYAVDHAPSGRSLGTFASARVAFELAARHDDWLAQLRPSIPRSRLLDRYRGKPPHPEAPSWPAEPFWRFALGRQRAGREAVRHAG